MVALAEAAGLEGEALAVAASAVSDTHIVAISYATIKVIEHPKLPKVEDIGLTRHTGFAEADVIKAYCAGSADNCASGTPKTDPLNALFICLPPTSPPRRKRQGPQPSGGSSGGAAPPNGCSSTPGPGNQLALLCSCGGQCLNPDADHIGRCDKPCV